MIRPAHAIGVLKDSHSKPNTQIIACRTQQSEQSSSKTIGTGQEPQKKRGALTEPLQD